MSPATSSFAPPTNGTPSGGTHSSTTAPPTVDFAQAVVLGVFLGARPTDGYSVEITSVRKEGDGLLAEYRERRPDPAGLVGQIVTAPFHLVTLPRPVGRVEFRQLDP